MKRLITLSSIILAMIFSMNTASAAVEHLNLPVCNLAVYPYNPAQPELYNNAAIPFVNFLSESVCKARTTYGQAYKQPPVTSENPLVNNPDIGNKNVPYAQHYHSYVNNSLEDSYYYRSFIDKFEIKLQSDALNNTEKLQVQCQTPAPSTFTGDASSIADCNGQINDTNFYGGVKVTYNSNTGVVLWEFGTVNKNFRPAMWGNNDSNPSDSDNFNEILTSVYGATANLGDANSLYRKFTPSVVIKTKNNNGEIWSGTTTSRALIRNYVILKSAFNAIPNNNAKFSSLCSALGDYTKWCPIATPAGGYATETLGQNNNQEWFWFPIGSVVSVWRKPPSQPSTLACADLQWDGAFKKPSALGIYFPDTVNPNALLPNEKAIMKFKTIYQNGTGAKRPLEYRWVSFYGDQNRPAWFKNDDTLFGGLMQVNEQILQPMLQSSLPAKLLRVAHAAPAPAPGSSSSAALSGASAGLSAAQQAAIIKLGDFKDEISASLSGNPLTDNDNQIYYSGGSEGVTLGVQAFYADGKNLPGDGPLVSTPDGVKQKANPCHLELVIQPKPVTCIDLTISPTTLAANTPVTFTVTPQFKPSNKSIPLNYRWSAEKYSSAIGQLGIGNLAAGLLQATNQNNLQFIPGASSNNGSDLSWVGNSIQDIGITGGGLANLSDPCIWGNCNTIEQSLLPINPSGPIENAGNGMLLNSPAIFGQTAVFNAGSLYANPSAVSAAAAQVSAAQAALPLALTYGGFKDAQSSPGIATNPFLETTDNKTYYTGGPENTLIKVQAEGKDGTLYPPCNESLVIPPGPPSSKCKQLKVKFFDGNTEVTKEQMVAGKTYRIEVDKANSIKDDNTPVSKFTVVAYNADGVGTMTAAADNAASCTPVTDLPVINPGAEIAARGTQTSTSVDCKYLYTPNAGDKITLLADPHDNVAACRIDQVIPEIPTTPICLALNLRVNGQYTLAPQIVAGQSYSLQVDPVTTLGHSISMVEWTENGDGKLIGEPSNPAICPSVIDNSSVVTLSVCRYIFASAPNANSVGFSVKAVPDNGVAACKAAAQNYTPPEVTPYCLYLDLNYDPNPFQTSTPTNMDATVVMSNGSKYNDYVRFTSTNGAGTFSGGYSGTSGSGTSNFRTQTDSTNNTRTVNYQNGATNSGINVYLSDTSVKMSAACMRQLQPKIKPPKVCTKPPTIVDKNDNRYCAEGGDSESYCWTIEGPDNDLLFTNGSNHAIGDCVVLDDNYTQFDLLVEDCNPLYRDYCYDTLSNDETPKKPTIEKRISKLSPLHYTTQVHFSTTGYSGAAPQSETVEYKLDYVPGNFEGDNNTMTARIYDPAFSGTIQGIKTSVDGQTTNGGTITFDFNVPRPINIDGYSVCSGSSSQMDKCYIIVSNGPTNSYLQIQGINSTDSITIKYKGRLQSGITIEDCRSGIWCNEKFTNQSRVDDLQYCEETTDENGVTTVNCTTIDIPEIYSNTTIADVVCSYFLTRASGDVFLEDELTYGIDVSKCYPFKNVSSTVVKPIPPIEGSLASTGTPIVVSINHEICSAGQKNFDNTGLDPSAIAALKELFGAGISENLSSQICEVGLVPGSDWNKESIAAAMAQNIGKLTRWDSGIGVSNTLNQVQNIKDKGNVYYYKGNGDTLTIDGLKIPEGSGALTIIVENADLQINGNIEYVDQGGQPALSATEIASLGVIVLNGNMYIAPDVEKLAGAYFVQRSDLTDYTVGNLFSGNKADNKQDSQKQLTINGSIYGNIGPLFMHRVASGDISKDEGAITIRYDQRIIQNPPAGLSDLLGTFSQTQIAQ